MTLGEIYKRYHRACYLPDDPLSIVKQFKTPQDLESAGFFAALLSYGRVEQINKSITALFKRMDNKPFRFIQNHDYKQALKKLDGFQHRFNTGTDMALTSVALRSLTQEYGSIENGLVRSLNHATFDLQQSLIAFRNTLFERAKQGSGLTALPNSFQWLIPSAEKGACKRLCMYLRWMVRPNDCIDLGLWHKVPLSKLIIPVDTHIAKMGKQLKFTKRKSADWKMAEEITAALRKYDAADPVKYDFALCSAGKMEFRGRGEV